MILWLQIWSHDIFQKTSVPAAQDSPHLHLVPSATCSLTSSERGLQTGTSHWETKTPSSSHVELFSSDVIHFSCSCCHPPAITLQIHKNSELFCFFKRWYYVILLKMPPRFITHEVPCITHGSSIFSTTKVCRVRATAVHATGWVISLPETNSAISLLKIGREKPQKGKETHLPAIYFQCRTVSFQRKITAAFLIVKLVSWNHESPQLKNPPFQRYVYIYIYIYRPLA